MVQQDMRDRILDAAENRARAMGYNGFSFREIAADVGVKSASVHYHFPTKSVLGEALAKRYTEAARAYLGPPEAVTPEEAMERVASLFREALRADDVAEGKMCLCGIFGAERDALPPEVEQAVAAFFRMLLDYLAAGLGPDWNGPAPEAIVASLEGALILARSLRDPDLFALAQTS